MGKTVEGRSATASAQGSLCPRREQARRAESVVGARGIWDASASTALESWISAAGRDPWMANPGLEVSSQPDVRIFGAWASNEDGPISLTAVLARNLRTAL
jgi:hypothetical protein